MLALDLMNAGVDLIVVDSITSMLPAIYFEKDTDEMKALENTKQIGAESRDFSNAWKMLNYANNKVNPLYLFLFHNQEIILALCILASNHLVGRLLSFIHLVLLNYFHQNLIIKQLKVK
jgi:hypothetical protein